MTEIEIKNTWYYARSRQLIVRITMKNGKNHEGRPMDISIGNGPKGFCCYLNVGSIEIEVPLELIQEVNSL